MNDQELDREIEAAVERDLRGDNVREWPLSATGKPVERVSRNPAPKELEKPQRAADLVAQAVAGLLRVEEELNAVLGELVGHPAEKPAEKPGASKTEAPMLDRLRHDARELAELALRLHARVVHLRERL